MTAIGGTVLYNVYRYHFWGKWSSQKHDNMSQKELDDWAKANKR